MKTKICTRCNINKQITDFYNDNNSKDGLTSQCKGCRKEYTKSNKKQIQEYKKKYNLKNKEKIKKIRKKYWLKHKKEKKEYDKNYYEQHKPSVLKKVKKYRESHRQELNEKQKKYNFSHKKEKCNYDKNYTQSHKKERNRKQKDRRKIDLNFRLSSNLRARITDAINKHRKNLTTMGLIGCEIEYLMYYLQCKFVKGMNWDNYGKWHIDHIKPCALFNLSKPSEQLKCFNYTNLQPLWAEDNYKKGIYYD